MAMQGVGSVGLQDWGICNLPLEEDIPKSPFRFRITELVEGTTVTSITIIIVILVILVSHVIAMRKVPGSAPGIRTNPSVRPTPIGNWWGHSSLFICSPSLLPHLIPGMEKEKGEGGRTYLSIN